MKKCNCNACKVLNGFISSFGSEDKYTIFDIIIIFNTIANLFNDLDLGVKMHMIASGNVIKEIKIYLNENKDRCERTKNNLEVMFTGDKLN